MQETPVRYPHTQVILHPRHFSSNWYNQSKGRENEVEEGRRGKR